ncbi:MAG TPA: ABC transporter permease [Thermoanaerobaculia bacterium]
MFDLKYAWRLLRKSWGYSLMCAIVIALSVGLVVFAYSLVYSQSLKPLGFTGSERWYSVQISGKAGADARARVDAYTYQELRKNNRSADYIGAFTIKRSESEKGKAVVLSQGQASTPLRAVAISPRLLAASGVPPVLGRGFQEADAQSGAAAVAIISHDTWQNYFAADPDIIGKTARIDTAPVQVVGVMPKDFFMFQDFELWLPLQLPTVTGPRDGAQLLSPMIRLGDNQNIEAIRNEMQSVVAAVNKDYPDVYSATRSIQLYPALRMYTHYQTPIVATVGLMAAALLLLACVNISMVFLARLMERSGELALRTALGASRRRLLRQCLLETVLIVILGLAGGWALAAIVIRWARGIGDFSGRILATGRYPNQLDLRPIDMLIAVLAAGAIWLLSTLVPAWRIARQEAGVVLASSGKGSSVRGSNKSVGLLVGLQVMVSSLVLVVCGNMVLAVQKEVAKPSGLTTDNVLLSTYPTVFDAGYAEPSQRLRYWEDLSAAIGTQVPGAEAAFATAVPSRQALVPAAIESRPGAQREGALTLPLSVVSDNYFKLLGLSLRSGRLFDSTDNSASLQAAVIDETMATRYWPAGDALGKRIQFNPADNGPWLTIVGVVSAVAGQPYGENEGAIYRPLRQAVPSEFVLLAKMPNGGSDGRTALRAAAFAVDRDLPLHNLQKFDDYMAGLNLRWSTLVQTFSVIALITAILAAAGLFGLISRSVVQRTQEVGIRRALGATRWQATAMFMRQGALYLALAVVAVGFGTVLMPLMSAVIYNILDRVVMVTLGVVLLIAAVIMTASYLPSRRAVVLEPGDALRHD